MSTKRVLAIHDLCAFGRCSLTAALPVISAMGFQVNPFPTAIFSNNLTYGDFTFRFHASYEGIHGQMAEAGIFL